MSYHVDKEKKQLKTLLSSLPLAVIMIHKQIC